MLGRKSSIKFYDTNSLLEDINNIEGKIYLSSVTLHELENIKTSGRKDEVVKYAARVATKWISENEDKYECVIVENKHYKLLKKLKLDESPDNLIIACAYLLDKHCTFVTNDMCCYNIAKQVFKLNVDSPKSHIKEDNYTGYMEISMTKNEFKEFEKEVEYENYGLLYNQYLIVKDSESDDTLGAFKWKGDDGFKKVTNARFYSNNLGQVNAREAYQSCVFDSMMNNKITMVKGKAGSGKSLLSMAFLFNRLDKHAIDKIIIFCNTTKARGAEELGYYKGTQTEKLLQSSIGSFLVSKLGDAMEVERLIMDGKLLLLPMSDIRGFDTTGMRAGIYITEAQNTSVDLMKLALQRIGEDSICIIDGDYTSQVDSYMYQGGNNGMKRISEVFRGQEFYGEVELKNIYRSKIAEIADEM